MDKFDRFQLLHRVLRTHKRPVPLAKLAEKLECSPKTVSRAMDSMRDHLGAPIEYFPESNGWHYQENGADLFELPGLWLTCSELQSLALLLQLLGSVGEGLLAEELSAVETHIGKLLQARDLSRSAFDRHIKILPVNHRYIPNLIYSTVSEGLLKQHCLALKYLSYNQQESRRVVSPQTLVYYRENWYLDAWCHLRNDLRTFSLARIASAKLDDCAFHPVSQDQLSAHFSDGYGIFAGQAVQHAVLRFLPAVAREIAMQQWHPNQTSQWDGDDYLLTIPYSDDKELIQDILRHVPNVYVESPVKLRHAARNRLQEGLELFSSRDF